MHKTIGVILIILFSLLFVSQKLHSNELPVNTRLATLAKVWGLLKYYHPKVSNGDLNWDQILTEAIDRVENALTFEDFNYEIQWLIEEAGQPLGIQFPYLKQDKLDDPLYSWIKNTSLFTWENIRSLTMFISNPYMNQYYVTRAGGAGNTFYENELPHTEPQYPTKNMRLLSLFRYWNIINYFFPYKDVIGENWDGVLTEFIPKFINASNAIEYHLTVKELTARINDSHAFTNSAVLSEFWGVLFPPFEVKYVEGKTVVITVFDNLLKNPDDVQVGDIITKIDGEGCNERRERLWKYIGASNDSSKNRYLNWWLLNGPSDTLELTIQRDGTVLNVQINRCTYQSYSDESEKSWKTDIWKILDGNIGYIHMGNLERRHVYQAMTELINTRAIIFDVRNYPNGTLYDITDYLNPQRIPFVIFTIPSLSEPGTFSFTRLLFAGPQGNNPDYYKGKVIILCNEDTQSHAEFTCMALQTAPQATVIGSQTSGADGNVSHFYLPGGIATYFSGIGVFYPDRTPTQRIGIVPDIEVLPTIKGIRKGRDEVLERAIQFIENNT